MDNSGGGGAQGSVAMKDTLDAEVIHGKNGQQSAPSAPNAKLGVVILVGLGAALDHFVFPLLVNLAGLLHR